MTMESDSNNNRQLVFYDNTINIGWAIIDNFSGKVKTTITSKLPNDSGQPLIAAIKLIDDHYYTALTTIMDGNCRVNLFVDSKYVGYKDLANSYGLRCSPKIINNYDNSISYVMVDYSPDYNVSAIDAWSIDTQAKNFSEKNHYTWKTAPQQDLSGDFPDIFLQIRNHNSFLYFLNFSWQSIITFDTTGFLNLISGSQYNYDLSYLTGCGGQNCKFDNLYANVDQSYLYFTTIDGYTFFGHVLDNGQIENITPAPIRPFHSGAVNPLYIKSAGTQSNQFINLNKINNHTFHMSSCEELQKGIISTNCFSQKFTSSLYSGNFLTYPQIKD